MNRELVLAYSGLAVVAALLIIKWKLHQTTISVRSRACPEVQKPTKKKKIPDGEFPVPKLIRETLLFPLLGGIGSILAAGWLLALLVEGSVGAATRDVGGALATIGSVAQRILFLTLEVVILLWHAIPSQFLLVVGGGIIGIGGLIFWSYSYARGL